MQKVLIKIRFKLGLLLLAAWLSVQVAAQERNRLKLIFTGDIMGHDTQIESALITGQPDYDYQPCFQYLEPYFSSADITIGNLEVTLAGPPYKGYPQFSSPDELATALKKAGFDILITANNHALDRQKSGLERTLRQLDNQGIIHTGTFRDPMQRNLTYPLVVEKNGIRIALLNYTYGTNGIKVESPNIVNFIDTAMIRQDLHKASRAEPDLTIVTMHWGKEYELTENRLQQNLASFAFRNGADAIIGSHPHVVQPVHGNKKGDLIVYSLGNLISNQRSRYRDGGIAFEMELMKTGGITEITGQAYLPVWVYKPKTKKGILFTLVPASLDSISTDALGMPADDRIRMKQFLMDTRSNLSDLREVVPSWMQ